MSRTWRRVLFIAFIVAVVLVWDHVVEQRLGEPTAFFVALGFALVCFTIVGLRRRRDRSRARVVYGEPARLSGGARGDQTL